MRTLILVGRSSTPSNIWKYYRYSVHEYAGDGPIYGGGNYGSNNQFRPQYPGPYGPNSRPIVPGDGQILVGPNGPSGFGGRLVWNSLERIVIFRSSPAEKLDENSLL